MKKEVIKNIFVGDLIGCQENNFNGFAIVHACKIPCHQNGVGYSKNLNSNHPNYLILENDNDLYLNLVDMNKINPRFTHPIFKKAFTFIEKNLLKNKNIFIHCNLGHSRSSAIAICYLARKNFITKTSFQESVLEFKNLYPPCDLGKGFHNYLEENWNDLIDL